MSTRLVGYQPQYFPRLHYYARILNADIFKISDNLQYVRRHAYPSSDGTRHNGPSYQAHSPIKTSQGMYLLDVPTSHVLPQRERMMNTVSLDYSKEWPRKHIRILELNYGRAPFFKKLMPGITALLNQPYENLAACTIASMVWGLAVLFEFPVALFESVPAELVAMFSHHGFRLKKIVRMSEEELHPADKTSGEDVNSWIVHQCRALGATEYYFGGTAGAAYLDLERIARSGITLVQQNWHCEEYPQQFPRHGFMPNLSILDLLMNVSPAAARAILATPNQ
ncbi:MAG TPA: WbqC family protein [Candidatus Paceibacterota bacterium]|nr:WbqC family protein [Candidatus Paceibacterota bacterium]